MFNLQGSELIIILLLALVVLGPEKLPEAMRRAGQFVAELRKMSSGFQQEFRSAVQEPMDQIRDTANTLRDSADFTKLQDGERVEKPKSAEMVAAVDPDAVPTDEVPFAGDAGANDDVGAPADVLPDDDATASPAPARQPGEIPPTPPPVVAPPFSASEAPTATSTDEPTQRPRPFGAHQTSSAAPRPDTDETGASAPASSDRTDRRDAGDGVERPEPFGAHQVSSVVPSASTEPSDIGPDVDVDAGAAARDASPGEDAANDPAAPDADAEGRAE